MNAEVTYKLNDAKRRKLLKQDTAVDDPSEVRAELGAARLLAAEALESGNATLANTLLMTIGKLTQCYTGNRLPDHERR